MDIVIPIGKGSYWKDTTELKYALRSLEKNFKDLGEVYIIGHKPKWLKNVNHIDYDDLYPDNKGACIISKLIFACDCPQISKDFLFVSDDQLMLKTMSSKDIKPYYIYDLKDFKFSGENKFWMQCLRNVKEIMEIEGLPCYNYEPHAPMVINKEKFRFIMNRYDWRRVLYPTLSLYFNSIIKNHKQLPDNYRVFYANELGDLSAMDRCYMAGYDDMALSVKFQKKIDSLFPKKCKYEK